MKVRERKPEVFEAIRFDPAGEHRQILPRGVRGIAAPGADNWGYEGCRYFFHMIGEDVEIYPGHWIIRHQSDVEDVVCNQATFEELYEPVAQQS